MTPPIRSPRYLAHLTALPLDDRCPSDARSCKHGGRPPGVSRKIPGVLFRRRDISFLSLFTISGMHVIVSARIRKPVFVSVWQRQRLPPSRESSRQINRPADKRHDCFLLWWLTPCQTMPPVRTRRWSIRQTFPLPRPAAAVY